MNRSCSLLLLLLCAALLLGCAGCSASRSAGYEVIARLDSEQFAVAFREGDALCEYVTAALRELAAEGAIARLSSQYLGADYSCLEGAAGAIEALGQDIPTDRTLMVGVLNGAAPLCWADDAGSFTGLIPDLVQLAAEKLGWQFEYREIRVENVAVELASGNVDCAWLPAAYAESAKYSLTPAWMKNSHLLIVRRGSGLNKVRDLKNHNIGLTDDTALNALKNNTKIFDTITVWTYTDLRNCFTALASGDCDAIVIDDIVSSHYLS